MNKQRSQSVFLLAVVLFADPYNWIAAKVRLFSESFATHIVVMPAGW